MTTRLPWWRERYERASQTDHRARLDICLAASKRALDEEELNVAFWWLNTAAMHCQELKARRTVVAGQKVRRRP